MYILDAIIVMWEGREFIDDNELDLLFFKIDFDKSYDRVEWDFILQSLQDMGFGKIFIKYVHCLFSNAITFVALNGKLSPAITLKRSIRQGCPLSPLLFVFFSHEAVTTLDVKAKLNKSSSPINSKLHSTFDKNFYG